MFVIYCISIAGSLLDTAVDRIVWHVVCLRFGNHLRQLEIIGGVGASLLHCNCDLTPDNRKDFSFRRVVLLFFVLNVCKF